jgi:tetratricopeptide (TPR) repeat protein
LITALLIGLITAVVFWPATFNQFVNFDDPDYVVNNSQVQQGLALEGVKWAFTTGHASNWHPLTWLSHMLDCQLFGMKPWGHHFTSVVIHALSAALLFVVLHRMTRSYWSSLMVALIWGLHPTRVESVAWASERKDVLSTLFWILVLWAYSHWTQKGSSAAPRSRSWYWLCLCFFVLGLMSKPMLVTLPFVLLLLDFWPLRRFPQESLGKLLLEKVPFIVLAMVSSTITIIVQQGAMSSVESVPIGARITNASIAYCRYLIQMFWPTNLAVFYPRREHWDLVWVVLAVLLLAVISGTAIALRRKRPYLLVGWLWYLGTLVPVIGLVQVGQQAMADRYTYIPTIGLLVMIALSINDWLEHRKSPASTRLAVVAFPAIACAVLTARQIPIWQDGKTLFRHTIAVTEKHPTPYHNLGTQLLESGSAAESLPYLQEAIRLRPRDSFARYNHGLALMQLGQTKEAINELQTAIALRPNLSKPHMKLGAALSSMGRHEEALDHFATAVQLDPKDAVARQLFAESLVGLKRVDEGIAQYREATRLQPRSGDAYFRLAQTLQATGRNAEAIECWQNGLNVEPNDVTARNNLGALLAQAGRFQDAADQFRAALQAEPTNADAKYNLEQAMSFLEKQRAK